MANAGKPKVIAIEEHYWDKELSAKFAAADANPPPHIRQRLEDMGALRLKEMDEAGVDMQVLSHAAPATQRLDAETAVRLAKATNDRLHQFIQTNPARFAGFAVLPTADPEAAADELARCVDQARLQGRDDPRPRRRPLHRRGALLADLRARRKRSTCRSICIRRCRIRP